MAKAARHRSIKNIEEFLLAIWGCGDCQHRLIGQRKSAIEHLLALG